MEHTNPTLPNTTANHNGFAQSTDILNRFKSNGFQKKKKIIIYGLHLLQHINMVQSTTTLKLIVNISAYLKHIKG